MRAGGNMDEPLRAASARRTAAQPLHIQRLEASLDMGPFMNYAQNLLLRPLTSSEDSDSDSATGGDLRLNTAYGTSSRSGNICINCGFFVFNIILNYRSSHGQTVHVQLQSSGTGSQVAAGDLAQRHG